MDLLSLLSLAQHQPLRAVTHDQTLTCRCARCWSLGFATPTGGYVTYMWPLSVADHLHLTPPRFGGDVTCSAACSRCGDTMEYT